MGLANQRTLIEAELMTQMNIQFPGIAIFGENSDEVTPANAAWIRMSITVLEVIYPCLNNVSEQTDALFNVQVFTPLAQGAGEASTKVDAAKSILKNSNLAGIEFLSFDIATGVVEAEWYNILLRATYRARE